MSTTLAVLCRSNIVALLCPTLRPVDVRVSLLDHCSRDTRVHLSLCLSLSLFCLSVSQLQVLTGRVRQGVVTQRPATGAGHDPFVLAPQPRSPNPARPRDPVSWQNMSGTPYAGAPVHTRRTRGLHIVSLDHGTNGSNGSAQRKYVLYARTPTSRSL